MKGTYIFVCNFNRLGPLKKLVASLHKRNYKNIVVIDNSSTYPPLLEWYKDSGVEVYHCKENYGPYALDILKKTESEFIQKYVPIIDSEYYVYTDSDVIPTEEVPDSFIDDMVGLVKKYGFSKLGMSLKIDDLPDHFKLKQNVINWELQFFHGRNIIEDPLCRLYNSPVDTTFAVHPPGAPAGLNFTSWRTAGNYFARHEPWYYDTDNLPEDEQFYYSTFSQTNEHNEMNTHWSIQVKDSIVNK